jgi:MinD-like ATPase involved in chromosome partitioning or flagellar assembly
VASRHQKSHPSDDVTDETEGRTAQLVDDVVDATTDDAFAHDEFAEDEDEPERPKVSVDLPATVHLAPDHELAVAIADIPVNPGQIRSDDSGTLSVTVGTLSLTGEPDVSGTADGTVDDSSSADQSGADSVFSRRDRLNGQVSARPEAAAMLTADRLLDTKKRKRPKPEGRWNTFVYAITLHMVNLGDSPAARARKAVDARIDKQFEGGTRFVPVLTRKGGVGKTTITALIGMALADVREDRIVAIDANPDRGTLAERVNKQTRSTVRDIVTQAASINSFNDFSTMVSRDETRLDILASDTDPLLAQAFDEDDYNVVADLAARFYSICLTDCGTGIVHSVMRATLQRADSVVIVSGGSIDEARLASETLTWLESNGYGDLVRNAVVALNTGTQGTNLVKLDEIEAHFTSRVREIVRIPYDPQLAAGSVINYKELRPLTKSAARELAALVVDGLPTAQGR